MSTARKFTFDTEFVAAQDVPAPSARARQKHTLTVEELDGLKATSTKAAYLWLALRPNAVSRGLVRSIRSLARHELGFDSAVYFQSQKSTMGYSDLNTNAVILQSIAHLLRTA